MGRFLKRTSNTNFINPNWEVEMSGRYVCANWESGCDNVVEHDGEYCAFCSDQDGVHLDKHDGLRITRDRRLKLNNDKQRRESQEY